MPVNVSCCCLLKCAPSWLDTFFPRGRKNYVPRWWLLSFPLRSSAGLGLPGLSAHLEGFQKGVCVCVSEWPRSRRGVWMLAQVPRKTTRFSTSAGGPGHPHLATTDSALQEAGKSPTVNMGALQKIQGLLHHWSVSPSLLMTALGSKLPIVGTAWFSCLY